MGVNQNPAFQITESLTLRAVSDNVSADERQEIVRRAQDLFAECCPKTMKPPRQSRRDKGTKTSLTTQASVEIRWLVRRCRIVTVAATLPRTHNLVWAGHVGAAEL
ncbi:MAG: hypothetical protein ACKPKO_39290, partial [Candidatus Fonsibacter sp.]